MTTTARYCWITLAHKRGQIVERMQAQLLGASEGEAGTADGLTATFDHSDRSWTIDHWGVEVAAGRGKLPGVEEAMRLVDRRRIVG